MPPDPRGVGTHERLGLPACGFYEATGRPCPSCGMTTAFALAARGRLGAAFLAQPAGLLLFALAAATAVLGPAAAVLGVPLRSRLTTALVRRSAIGLLVSLLAAWLFKLFVT